MANTEEFTTNDRYLIHEYHKHNSSNYYLCDIGYRTFVVPCRYIARAKNGVEGIRLFKEDLLDFQQEELHLYKEAGKRPRLIKAADEKYVVPFNTPQDFDPKEVFKSIIEKAEVKYNTVINAHRMLREIPVTEFSTAALDRYTQKLAKRKKGLLLAPESIKQMEIYKFLCQHIKAQKKNVAQNVIKVARKLRAKILDNEFKALKKYRPKYWKFALLAGMLSASIYHIFHSKKELDANIPPSIMVSNDTTSTFTDFRGKTYSDTLGNLQQIRDLQPQIMTVLLSIEGFSENAFLDGRGNPTIGSGFTILINKDGSETKVKLGDKTTIKKDMLQNTRYIEREFSEILGDNIKKTLTPKDNYTCIGAGYCWGTQKFIESSFFKSLKNNEPISEQCRKLSGFRNPKGLIKREFVLAQLLSGNWKVEELLDMPIYYVKGKGYVHCGIYTLDFHDCVPCKKDRKGHYLKDKKGYDIPVIEKDGFCKEFYQPPFKEILQKIHKNPVNRGMPYKTVRQLLHKDLLAKINNPNIDETFFTFQVMTQLPFQK